LEHTLPLRGPGSPSGYLPPRCRQLGPRPGWLAVSVTLLRGYRYPVSNGAGGEEYLDGPWCSYFLRFFEQFRALEEYVTACQAR
jgi:hypothetical protein